MYPPPLSRTTSFFCSLVKQIGATVVHFDVKAPKLVDVYQYRVTNFRNGDTCENSCTSNE